MTSKSAFTVFSHTTFIHFWQQQQWPWRALSARTVMQQCLCEAVIFVRCGRLICVDPHPVILIWNIVFSFLGYFSAGTSYKWRHNTKCGKKKPENTRRFWELDAGHKQENVRQSWQQSGACNASSKKNSTLNILCTQNKWSGETHLTSCHVLLISIMSSLHPVCSSTSPQLSHGEYRKAWRETADLSRTKCRPLDRVHPWRQPIMSHAFGGVRSAAWSVHLSDMTGIGLRFCNVRISPSQTCATGNPTGILISRLPSASLQASYACIHVRLNLEQI